MVRKKKDRVKGFEPFMLSPREFKELNTNDLQQIALEKRRKQTAQLTLFEREARKQRRRVG